MDKLDEIDIKILNILQENARATNKELASALGMTVSPVFERIKKLEKRGYIKNYVALVDPEKINQSLLIFLFVSTKEHNRSNMDEMVEYMKSLPEVMECYHISGDYDYMLKVVIKGMAEYEQFLLNKLTTMNNFANVKSTFVLSTIKHKTSYPI